MYLVCGEALFDFFSEEDASGQAAKLNYKAIAGGSPFNVAVGLRRLGIEAGLFGGLSSDFLGRRLRGGNDPRLRRQPVGRVRHRPEGRLGSPARGKAEAAQARL